jgi:hypothetical protein
MRCGIAGMASSLLHAHRLCAAVDMRATVNFGGPLSLSPTAG